MMFLFLLFKRVLTTDFIKRLFEANQSQNLGKRDLQESSSLGYKTELKIDVNPGLA